ncbi:MAG TPA: hypothetical protein VEH77_14565, partial [Roseiarcus sp.]|nr:hypothetical protein [Roseiarcus sp.]
TVSFGVEDKSLALGPGLGTPCPYGVDRRDASTRLLGSFGRQFHLDVAGFHDRHFDEELQNLDPQSGRQVTCFPKLGGQKHSQFQ